MKMLWYWIKSECKDALIAYFAPLIWLYRRFR
jgi:hypothetical protein